MKNDIDEKRPHKPGDGRLTRRVQFMLAHEDYELALRLSGRQGAHRLCRQLLYDLIDRQYGKENTRRDKNGK